MYVTPFAIRFLPLLLFALLFIAQLFTLQHCATPTPPNGGARDTLGPVLIAEETTPNFQTNFRPEEIIMTFDEWVELDPKQEILISPPLELGEDNRPYLKRRSLIIPLQGLQLRDSVTYVVNVGAAVKDLNEGNPTENLRFVFATGPVLDSATVSGTLVRDYSGEPLENGTFALFGNLADTAVTTQNPTYFAQTDEEGKFTVYNIRPGSYRAIALERNPSATNYFIDVSGFAQPLAIGFRDSLLNVADGSNAIGLIQVSSVAKALRINSVDTTDFGRLKITLNQAAENVDLTSQQTYFRRNDKDTINLYYTNAAPDSLVVAMSGIPADTFVYGGTVAAPGKSPALLSGPPGKINPEQGLIFKFDRPLGTLDTALVSLKRDTVDNIPFSWVIDSLNPTDLQIRSRWITGAKYSFMALPGALSSLTGSASQDTLQKTFSPDSPEKFGSIRITLSGMDSTQAYVLQLIKGKEILTGSQRYFSASTTIQIEYTGLPPGKYKAEIIEDTNRNRRYDAGNFFLLRQPETVRRFEIEELRANWEVDEAINLEDKQTE